MPRVTSKKQDPAPCGKGHQAHSRHAGPRSGIQKNKGKNKIPGSPIKNVGDDEWRPSRE